MSSSFDFAKDCSMEYIIGKQKACGVTLNHFLLFPIGSSWHARINGITNTFFIVHSNVKGILSPPFDLRIQSIII